MSKKPGLAVIDTPYKPLDNGRMNKQRTCQNRSCGENSNRSEYRPDAARVLRRLQRRSFATLATTSANGRPHVAGVLYELADSVVYINTLRLSRKARNVAATGSAALCVPIRRLPIGPPSTVHVQSEADVIDMDHADIAALLGAGKLKSITSHGELELPDACFIRVSLDGRRLLTHGLGMSIPTLIGDPIAAGGVVALRG